MNKTRDILTNKKTWIWIVLEAILFGMFVYSFNQYYFVQIDAVNQYPFRETVALMSALISLGLTMVLMLLHLLFALKAHQFKGWLLCIVFMLAIALLLVDPLLNLVDVFSTWLFHLLPDHLMETIASWLEPLSRWLKAL